MSVKTVLVCETQVPLVRGGAELLVQQLVTELRRARRRDRSRVAAVQVVSEGRDPAARRGVAAARSQREQRPPDRSDHRDQVPDLFRAAPAQGLLARASASRGLRAVRHAVQRLRPRRARRRAARSADGARRRDARRVPRPLHDLADGVGAAAEVQRPRVDAALPSAAHRAATCRTASTGSTCCRWRGSRRTSASISPSAPSRTCRRICGWSSSAKAAIGRAIEQAAEEIGVADRVTFAGAVSDDRTRRALSRRALPRLCAVRRGLRAGDARSVPGARSR